MSWLIENYLELIAIASGAVALATAVTKLTPTKRDDEIVSKARKVLEFISLRLGK